jgi:phage/plasmid primase-like uncharacterized protein
MTILDYQQHYSQTKDLGRHTKPNFTAWLEENKMPIEDTLIEAAHRFIEDLCLQYDTTRSPPSHLELRYPSEWISLGYAKNTRDRDKCTYKTNGIEFTSSGIPQLQVTFTCFQGGGTHHTFNSAPIIQALWEQHQTGVPRNKGQAKRLAKQAAKRQAALENAQRRAALEAKRKATAIANDRALWEILAPQGISDYLTRKGFISTTVSFNSEEMGCRFGNDDRGRFIALPIIDLNGDLKGLQKIYDNPKIGKKFTYGLEKTGHFILLGELAQLTNIIRIVEGYTTGKTVQLATGEPVICALDAGNLLSVAQVFRNHYPDKFIIIHCDNDQWKEGEINPQTGQYKGNTGVTKGIKVTKLIPATFHTIPQFEDLDTSNLPTDYNDLYQLAGLEEVRRQLTVPLPIQPKPIKFYSPTEAKALLEQQVEAFYQVDQSKVIALTAGGGKTQAMINHLLPGTEIYEPNHAKCEELKAEIETRHTGLKVQIPKGRSAKFNTTQHMCQKHEAAERIAQLGHRVYNCLCHNGEETCEFLGKDAFDEQGKLSNPTCPWVRQWLEPAEVRILPHAYLELERSNLEMISFTPERIVIDERFYSGLLKTYQLPLLDFKGSDIDDAIKKPIIHALREELPLLKTLREAGITATQLQEAIDTSPSTWPDLHITPSMSLAKQLSRLAKLERPSNAKKVLQTLLKEWDQPRDECTGVYYYIDSHKVEQISVHYQKPITRLRNERHPMLQVVDCLEKADDNGLTMVALLKSLKTTPNWLTRCRQTLEQAGIICHIVNKDQPLKLALNYQAALEDFRETTFYPLLILDADADQRLLDPLLGHRKMEYLNIHCPDNLHVTQLCSASVCATSLKKSPDLYLDLVVKWTESQLLEGKKVKIGGAQLYTGNPNQDIQPHPKLVNLGDNVQFTHFGGLRGLNHFKNIEAGITIGRNQPPLYLIENEARALFANDPKPLQLLGSQPLPKVPVAYRMRDGSLRWVNVERHPDERIQAILEQYREREIEQDIRRLRTVHHQGDPKEYFIMTNLPLPTIVVDELKTTREMNHPSGKTQILMDHFFLSDQSSLVMPLTDPSLLRRECPQSDFNTDDAARKFCQRLIGQNLIETLLGEVQFENSVETISYRIKGQRGKSSKALIACSYQQAKAQLEKWLKQEVIIEEVPAPPGPLKREHPPHFEIDKSVVESLGTIDEVIDYLDSCCHDEVLWDSVTDLLTEQVSVERLKDFIVWIIEYNSS